MSCTNESVTVFNDRWMLTQQATAGSSLLGCDSGCTAGYLFIGRLIVWFPAHLVCMLIFLFCALLLSYGVLFMFLIVQVVFEISSYFSYVWVNKSKWIGKYVEYTCLFPQQQEHKIYIDIIFIFLFLQLWKQASTVILTSLLLWFF